MTMLMHTRGRCERVQDSSERRNAAGARPATAHLAVIKRFFLCAIAALLAGGALAAIMAIKVVAYLPRLNY